MKLIDADWRKTPEAIRLPCPGYSVIVRDRSDDRKSRRIPCSTEDEMRQLMCALAYFSRADVDVIGATDPA